MNIEPDIDEELAQKFIEVLRNCKHPCESFPAGSKSLQLAEEWLNYLMHYHCHSNEDRRTRTTYLFGLSKCIDQKRLRGPFVKEPPKGRLPSKLKVKRHSDVNMEEQLCFRCNDESDIETPPSGPARFQELFELPRCLCRDCKEVNRKDSETVSSMLQAVPAIENASTTDNRQEEKQQQTNNQEPIALKQDNNSGVNKDGDVDGDSRLLGGQEPKHEPSKKECALVGYLKQRHGRSRTSTKPPKYCGRCSIEKNLRVSSEQLKEPNSDMFHCMKTKYHCLPCNQSLTVMEMLYLEQDSNKTLVETRNDEDSEGKVLSKCDEPDRISTSTYVLRGADCEKDKIKESESRKPVLQEFMNAFNTACDHGTISDHLASAHSRELKEPPVAPLKSTEAWLHEIHLAKSSCKDANQKQRLELMEAHLLEAQKQALYMKELKRSQNVQSESVSRINFIDYERSKVESEAPLKTDRSFSKARSKKAYRQTKAKPAEWCTYRSECPPTNGIFDFAPASKQCPISVGSCEARHPKRSDGYGMESGKASAHMHTPATCYANVIFQRFKAAAGYPILTEQPIIKATTFSNNYSSGFALSYQKCFTTDNTSTTVTSTSTFEIDDGPGNAVEGENLSACVSALPLCTKCISSVIQQSSKRLEPLPLCETCSKYNLKFETN